MLFSPNWVLEHELNGQRYQEKDEADPDYRMAGCRGANAEPM
jgi:hypothetical protein